MARRQTHRTGSLLLAAERAVDVGASLMRRGRSHIGALIDKGDRDYATTVDVAIEEAIVEVLGSVSPEIPVLGEEEGGDRPPSGPFWVIDPIDGTINFSKESPLCGIALALIEGSGPVLGIVDLPLLGERFVGCEGLGAYLNGRRLALREVERVDVAMVGLSDFAPGDAAENRVHLEVMRRLAAKALRVRLHGAASLDLAWLAAGRLDATLMLSNKLWDVSAGVLIVREAGGQVFDHDGSRYTSSSLFTIASGSAIANDLLELVQQALVAAEPEGSAPPH